MLIHLTPRLFVCPVDDGEATLIGIQMETFGIDLRGEVDVTARRPFPNKRLLVACRKVGRKAVNGILVETKRPVKSFTTATRWMIEGIGEIRHEMRYEVLDEDHGAVSESMVLWYATSPSLGGFATDGRRGWRAQRRRAPNPGWM